MTNSEQKKLVKEIRREARVFDTDMIMGCSDREWLIKVCEAQNNFLYEIAEKLEEKNGNE